MKAASTKRKAQKQKKPTKPSQRKQKEDKGQKTGTSSGKTSTKQRKTGPLANEQVSSLTTAVVDSVTKANAPAPIEIGGLRGRALTPHGGGKKYEFTKFGLVRKEISEKSPSKRKLFRPTLSLCISNDEIQEGTDIGALEQLPTIPIDSSLQVNSRNNKEIAKGMETPELISYSPCRKKAVDKSIFLPEAEPSPVRTKVPHTPLQVYTAFLGEKSAGTTPLPSSVGEIRGLNLPTPRNTVIISIEKKVSKKQKQSLHPDQESPLSSFAKIVTEASPVKSRFFSDAEQKKQDSPSPSEEKKKSTESMFPVFPFEIPDSMKKAPSLRPRNETNLLTPGTPNSENGVIVFPDFCFPLSTSIFRSSPKPISSDAS